jgi:hypothetical protein
VQQSLWPGSHHDCRRCIGIAGQGMASSFGGVQIVGNCTPSAGAMIRASFGDARTGAFQSCPDLRSATTSNFAQGCVSPNLVERNSEGGLHAEPKKSLWRDQRVSAQLLEFTADDGQRVRAEWVTQELSKSPQRPWQGPSAPDLSVVAAISGKVTACSRGLAFALSCLRR